MTITPEIRRKLALTEEGPNMNEGGKKGNKNPYKNNRKNNEAYRDPHQKGDKKSNHVSER